MAQICVIGKNIYSVDMMFAYINLFKKDLKIHKVPLDSLKPILAADCWGATGEEVYSPFDVIAKSKKIPKKYLKDELMRIKQANLSYPIIMFEDMLIDGVHRLVKATMMNKSDTINAYKFNKKLMKKFILDNNLNYEYVNKMNNYDFMELFYKRF